MRLSEAIRLGAMLSPQRVGGDMSAEGRCALSGAADVAGIDPVTICDIPTVQYGELYRRFHVLSEHAECPIRDCAYGGKVGEVMLVIWHLNDTHFWTRERIADWVEQVEHSQGAEAITVKVSVEG